MRGCVVVAMVLGAATARAEPSAEQMFDEGQREYDAGHYAAAVARWQAAYSTSRLPLIVLNIAQARRLEGDCASALAAYRGYVELEPRSKEAALAHGFIRELEPRCGESTRPSAEITRSAESGPARSEDTLKIAGLTVSGAGIAVLVGGLVLGKHSSTLGDRVSAACAESCDWTSQKDTDAAGRRDAAIGYALDALGAAAIVGGAITYYLGARASEVTVSPISREGGAVVSWSGSW